MKEENFDLGKVINNPSKPSITSFGSEFKSPDLLDHLLGKHPRWKYLKQIISEGSLWYTRDINEMARSNDLEGAISCGNHKSAKKEIKVLTEGLTKEIKKGWQLLLPLEKAKEIPGLVMSPMGVATALGISANGKFVPKKRITHDLSFPGIFSEESTNSRVIKELLEPCMFGYTFLRLIHKIVQLRNKYPKKIIWIRKEDAKSAYRRIHLHPRSSFQVGVQIEIDGVSYL